MQIAACEFIPTEMIYSLISSIVGQPPNLSFAQVGFEHHLVMNNFGTLGFILGLLPLFYVL